MVVAKFLIQLFFLIHIGLVTVVAITYTCSSNAACGCSLNSAVLTKIVGGERANTNTWGWAVSIRVSNSHICGGSLISSTLVLTAAHCLASIKSLNSLSINSGSQYLSVIDQQRSISSFFIHPGYNAKTFVNDIAIMRLASPLDLNDRALAIICLPPSTITTTTSEYPPTGSTVVAIGWGVLSSGSKTSSNTLQQVSLQVISSTAANCRNSLVDVNKQFCAGVQGGGKDTCQGDSGGPLMMFTNSQWQLVGITSYGTGCALAAYAGVYTRVSDYRTWISCFVTNNTLSCPFKNLTMGSSIGSNLLTYNFVHLFCFFFFFSAVI